MGRAPRAEFIGATYHVFSRGNRRERIFLDDEDYQAYLASLRELAAELGVAVIAYCLMPNHPHLCIRTEGEPLSVFMHRLNTRHAKRFNGKYGVRGHLHESRYQALLVDEDLYLVRLVRYIHRNPLRAELALDLRGWPYSSHGEYLAPSSWILREPVLRKLGGLAGYESFVAQETTDEDGALLMAATRGFRYAGGVDSVQRLAQAAAKTGKKARPWMPLGRARPNVSPVVAEMEAAAWLGGQDASVGLRDLQGPDLHEPLRGLRRALARYLRQERQYSLRAIGQVLGRDEAAVSRLVQRGRNDKM